MSLTQTDNKKRLMIDALEKSLGVVTTACKSVGIARQTHYEWMREDKTYKAAVDDIADISIDFGESMLHKRMQDGSDTAIIFFLKTKGKSRGYVERTEVHNRHEVPDMTDDELRDRVMQLARPLGIPIKTEEPEEPEEIDE